MKIIDPEHQKIGRRIRALRVGRNMSQKQLAERMGIAPASLDNIEVGKIALRLCRIFQLREILGCSAYDIIDDRENLRDRSEARNQQDIGRRVAIFRRSVGMTQADLAEKLGVTGVTVHTIERGLNEVSLKNLFRICEVLGCSMSDLFEAPPIEEKKPKSERRKKVVAPEYRKISDRIRKLRTAKGMSLTELAEGIGISLSNMSKIECGKNEPPLKNLFRIREVLGCRMGDFFEDWYEVEMRPPAPEMCENIQLEYQKIGRRILTICADRKISRAELADRMGVTLPCLHKIVSGRGKTRLKRLFQISEILGCPIKDLFETPTADDLKTVDLEYRKIGGRIRIICEQSHTTPDQLAARMGITPDALAGIERGRRELTLENLFLIRRHLGCAMSDLFDGGSENEIRVGEIIKAVRVVKKNRARTKQQGSEQK